MESQFVTAQKGTKQLRVLLDGSFSESERALPVEIVNRDSTFERVTFQIKKSKELQLPLFQTLFRLSRFPLFSLLATPLFFEVIFFLSQGYALSVWSVFRLLVALFLIHTGVLALNDYRDHMSGFDRVYRVGGSRLIQEGAVQAYRIRHYGIVALTIGILLGMSFIFQSGWPLFIVVLLSALVVGFLLWGGSLLKKVELTALACFFSFGPLLFIGVNVALVGEISPKIVVAGVVIGYLATFTFLLKHFETMVADRYSESPNWAGKIGFDSARKFLILRLVLTWPILAATINYLQDGDWLKNIWFIWVWLAPMVVSYFIGVKLLKCQSPLSSSIRNIRYLGILLHFFVVICLGITTCL